MPTVADIAEILQRIAPPELAEDWDNVGLLVGDPRAEAERVMTCLTVTPETAEEALDGGANLVITHHPIPFRPVTRLTTETTVGRLLLRLIGGGVAVYSAHTAFDSAVEGINARLAAGLGLRDVEPLVPAGPRRDNPSRSASGDARGGSTQAGSARPGDAAAPGTGRLGRLPEPIRLAALAARLRTFLGVDRLRYVGLLEQDVQRVAIGCGSAGSLLDDAARAGCQCMVLGEASFHTCLEAKARGVSLLLPGHDASERFALRLLTEMVAEQVPEIEVWTSRRERDPIEWLA